MRILMLAQSFSPVVGGEERIVEDLSSELSLRGHRVTVATLCQPAGEPPPRATGSSCACSAARPIASPGWGSTRSAATPLPGPTR